MIKILILGVNGFIGHHLSERILSTTSWHVYGMDMCSDRVMDILSHERFHFFEGDITINKEWVEYHVKKCDVIIPLVAIATPAIYITDPLRVFELDFEANLPIVRAAVRYGKRLIFPSTSEVYGMSQDDEFNSDSSPLVYGPINKTRWIYACSKQLMDRVIFAYGQKNGLIFTLFRPFNWVGSRLDNVYATKEGSSRVITQFLGQIMHGKPIQIVGDGLQRRCFTDISDGIDALMKILENQDGVANGKIYNIGNPDNDLSILDVAKLMLRVAHEFPQINKQQINAITYVTPESYYGEGYQDATRRVPAIENTVRDLDWQPSIDMATSLRRIFEFYCHEDTELENFLKT
jgi:nucleoside-diphosphate-sugar epimerase